jgi:hypothetical protein
MALENVREHRRLDSAVSRRDGHQWVELGGLRKVSVCSYCKLLLRFSRGQSEAVDSATSSRQTACIWTAISWEERRAAAAVGEAETMAIVLLLDLLCSQRRACSLAPLLLP